MRDGDAGVFSAVHNQHGHVNVGGRPQRTHFGRVCANNSRIFARESLAIKDDGGNPRWESVAKIMASKSENGAKRTPPENGVFPANA